jgi:serine/threonine protein kinase
VKVCPSCFTEASDDTRFCPNCGEGIPAGEDEDSSDLVGRTIAGKFKVLSPVGEGAMGSIWKAEQTSLGKMVCIKVLHQHLSGDKTVSKRFHREARAASRIKHSNAINIIDFGMAEDGTHYIAMDYIDGTDLAHVIRKEFPIGVDRVFNMVGQICTALDEAHEQGVIHRDLKPENIMVEHRRHQKDFVTVLDFGIAKITDPAGENPETFHTMAGIVCGTPEYMSPEQARGESLDARSDIYSLGVIMYHMFTGKVPFTADTPIGVVTKHLIQEPVRPRILQEDIHPAVEQLILQLMAKDRDERPESCMEVKRRMEEILRIIQSGEAFHQTAPMSRPSGSELAQAVKEEIVVNATSPYAEALDDNLEIHGRGFGLKITVALTVLVLLGVGSYFGYMKFFGSGGSEDTVSEEQTAEADQKAQKLLERKEREAADRQAEGTEKTADSSDRQQGGMTSEQMLKLAGQMTAYTRTLGEYQLAYAQNDRMLNMRMEQWKKLDMPDKVAGIEALLNECSEGKQRITRIQGKVEAGNLTAVDTAIEVEKVRVALISEKAEMLLAEPLPGDAGQAGKRVQELTAQIGKSRAELTAYVEELENKKKAWAETPQTAPLEEIDALLEDLHILDGEFVGLVDKLDEKNVGKLAVQYGMRLGKQDVLKDKVQAEMNREVGETRAELEAKAIEDKKKADERRKKDEERRKKDDEERRKKDAEKAIKTAEVNKLKAAEEQKKKKEEAKTKAKEFEKLGDESKSQGSYAKAKAYYKQALKLRSSTGLHKKLGKTYNSMGDYANGAKHLRTYIKLKGSSLSPAQKQLIESQIRK